MDSAAFDIWLAAIPLLTSRQRREALMCLALAEADDEAASVAADASPMSADGSSGAADSMPVEARATVESDDRPIPVSASAAAQSRVESADVRIAPAGGSTVGVTPATYHVTAAVIAGAHSMA